MTNNQTPRLSAILTAIQNTCNWLIFSIAKHRATLLSAAILGFGLGLGFLSSYFVRLYDVPLFNIADKAGNKAATTWQQFTRDDDASFSRMYSSILLPIAGDEIRLPRQKLDKSGGSLASWDDQLIAFSQEGTFYLVTEDREVRELEIEAPNNGIEGYRKVARTKPYNSYTHNFNWLRYNDVSVVQAGDRKGLVVSYTRFDETKACYTSALAILSVENLNVDFSASADEWEVLFETKPCLPLKEKSRAIEGHMAGGRMAFDGNETLYFTVGDYHWDGMYGPNSVPGSDLPTAQDPESDYGRVMALNLLSGEARQISRGQRNMQGIAFDGDGQLWTVEHGIRGGDELNRVVEGANYGWPYETYGTLYTGIEVPNTLSFGRHETYDKPAISWLPSIAVSGLALVDGFHSAWDGDLLAATLAGQKLVRIRLSENRVVFTEFIDIGQRLRYVHQHTDGGIVLYTDAASLVFLQPRQGGIRAKYIDQFIDQMRASEAIKAKTRTVLGRCMECHSMETFENDRAPSLSAFFENTMGTTPFENYSSAMKSDNRAWTRDLLTEFLRDPQATVPGSVMPGIVDTEDEVLSALIDVLVELNSEIECEEWPCEL